MSTNSIFILYSLREIELPLPGYFFSMKWRQQLHESNASAELKLKLDGKNLEKGDPVYEECLKNMKFLF